MKLRCEKLAVWLEMKEYNDPGYETKCWEFEMLQLVEKYLQDDVGDYNKIISNEAKKIKTSRRDRRLTRLKGNMQVIHYMTKLVKFLEKCKIYCAANHRDLQGKGVIILMENAASVKQEVSDQMTQMKDTQQCSTQTKR